MTGVELRFLGDFEVLRNGRAQPVPPSKKTRALLAYLCLNPRPFRREHLCELLWEVPDDPRGSLRWSLSKIRRLIDDERQPRIIADRSSVAVRTDDLSIDVSELRRLARGALTSVPLEALEAAAARFDGNFLEGIEFSDFHDFHSWCVAEREQALRDRAAILSELRERLTASPERALPYARALVGLSPYEEAPRAALIRLLYAAKLSAEAEQQYQLGLRMLKEAGVSPAGVLEAARRGPRIDAPRAVTPARPEPAVVRSPPAARALVGRETELAVLHEAMTGVTGRAGAGLLLVDGAPGMGKSRMLEALLELARASGALVLRATAFESDAMRPFALWIDALRSLRSGEYERIFGDADVNNRGRLFAGLSELVARAAAERPVLIVFDDLHWSDESSAAALHYVLRMNREQRVLGVVAVRDGALHDNVPVQQALRGLRRDGLLRELRLGPLPEDALARLIAEEAPGLDGGELSRECGGNPLLAIELARAEREGAAGGSLAELVRERLARFSVTGADVVRWAAVLRPRIDVATLVRFAELGPEEVGEALEQAERYAMLVPHERGLRFSHELIARAVYTDISPLRRQVMHRRVAELLEQDTALDLAKAADLAHHATQSGDPGLAARALASAGRLCLRFFANEDALSIARKGLQFAGELADAERVRALIELNDILLAAGPLDDWEAAAENYAALAESALDHGALEQARLGYQMAAYVRWTQGKWNAAREQSLRAERALRGTDSEAQIVGMAETAKCLIMLERDVPQADAMLMEADALARRRRFNHHAIQTGLGLLRYHENRLDEAEELLEQARSLCKSAGDRLNEFLAGEYLVMIDLQRGRTAAARERAGQLVALGERIREGSERPFAHALLGLCRYALEDDAAPLDAALEALRVVDAKYRLAYILTRAALLDCERGRKDSAGRRAREALGYAQILERPTEMLLAHAVLARECNEASSPVAVEHVREVERLRPTAAAWTGDIAARLSSGR